MCSLEAGNQGYYRTVVIGLSLCPITIESYNHACVGHVELWIPGPTTCSGYASLGTICGRPISCPVVVPHVSPYGTLVYLVIPVVHVPTAALIGLSLFLPIIHWLSVYSRLYYQPRPIITIQQMGQQGQPGHVR